MPAKPCRVLMIESSVNEKKAALELSASLNILSIIASEKKTFQPGNRPETKLYWDVNGIETSTWLVEKKINFREWVTHRAKTNRGSFNFTLTNFEVVSQYVLQHVVVVYKAAGSLHDEVLSRIEKSFTFVFS